MKRFFTVAASLGLLIAGCRTAQTQNEPQTISAPVTETPPPAKPLITTNAPVMATPSATEAPTASAPAAASNSPRLSYSSCHVDGPYIAMTFDDGPSAELTPKLLDMLKQRGIHATFFLIGEMVIQHPEIVQRIVAEGHQVGNHSWNHPQLNKLGADAFRKQIEDTNAAIVKACGVKPVIMRPPYGATNASLNKILNDEYGLKVIQWEIDPLDWKYHDSQRVHDQIVNYVHPGDIILAHDIHATTVAAMPGTFDDLLAKGYKFVTVSQLIAMDHPLPPPTSAPKKEDAVPPSKKKTP